MDEGPIEALRRFENEINITHQSEIIDQRPGEGKNKKGQKCIEFVERNDGEDTDKNTYFVTTRRNHYYGDLGPSNVHLGVGSTTRKPVTFSVKQPKFINEKPRRRDTEKIYEAIEDVSYDNITETQGLNALVEEQTVMKKFRWSIKTKIVYSLGIIVPVVFAVVLAFLFLRIQSQENRVSADTTIVRELNANITAVRKISKQKIEKILKELDDAKELENRIEAISRELDDLKRITF